MMNFLQTLNKLGKINVVNAPECVEFKENAPATEVVAIDLNNQQSVSRIIDFRGLFADINEDFGLVISKDEVMFESGTTARLREVFGKAKADTRKIKPQLYDFVEVINCFNGEVFISNTTARPKSSFQTFRGIVKEIKDDVYTVVVSGEVYKLPSICLKRVPRTIMSKTMKDVCEYMLQKSRKPVFLPEYNYMDLTPDGKFIQYIATDRLDRFDGKFWDKELREKYATQKKIRGVLKALFTCTDEEMDTVIMLYGSTDIKVEVLTGEKLLSVFESSNNANSGTLGNSCMLGKPKSYFEIYKENASAVIIKDDSGKIVVRAIMWELYSETTRRKITLVDRIYAKNDSMIPLVKNWAMKQGYHTLKTQGHTCKTMITPRGEEVRIGDFHVRLKGTYEKLPYIDTMMYIVGKKAFASGYIINAHSTGGDASTF